MTTRQIDDRLGKAKSHLYAIQNALITSGRQTSELGETVEEALTAIGHAQDALEEVARDAS